MGWFAERAKLKKQKADDAACRDLLARLEGTKSGLAEMAEESAKEFIPIIQNLINEVLEAKPPSEACEVLKLASGLLHSLIKNCHPSDALQFTAEMSRAIRASGDSRTRALYSDPGYVTARSAIFQDSSRLFMDQAFLTSLSEKKSKLDEMIRYGAINQVDASIQIRMLKDETQKTFDEIKTLWRKVDDMKTLVQGLEREEMGDILEPISEGETPILNELGIDD